MLYPFSHIPWMPINLTAHFLHSPSVQERLYLASFTAMCVLQYMCDTSCFLNKIGFNRTVCFTTCQPAKTQKQFIFIFLWVLQWTHISRSCIRRTPDFCYYRTGDFHLLAADMLLYFIIIMTLFTAAGWDLMASKITLIYNTTCFGSPQYIHAQVVFGIWKLSSEL